MPEDIQLEIEKIKARNARVESDKAWESSKFRILSLAVFTYLAMVLLMWVIGTAKPFASAAVPTLGFMLSTLSLRGAKTFWQLHIYKQKTENHAEQTVKTKPDA